MKLLQGYKIERGQYLGRNGLYGMNFVSPNGDRTDISNKKFTDVGNVEVNGKEVAMMAFKYGDGFILYEVCDWNMVYYMGK